MKGSKLNCFYGFYCCRYNHHCWLTILIGLAFATAQVSPKITTITPTTTNSSSNELQPTSFAEYNNTERNDRRTILATTATASPLSTFTISRASTSPTTVTTPITTRTRTPLKTSTEFQPYKSHTTASATTEKNASNGKGRRPRELSAADVTEKCRQFVEGNQPKNELYSPDYPNNYPRNISCTRVIEAPEGKVIRLDFRNFFHIEMHKDCKFDFLEIRDGQYGYSDLLGTFCGTDFPNEITSRERYLWLHFQSDESIEYSGFIAVFEFHSRPDDSPSTDINCTIHTGGNDGYVNSTDVSPEIIEIVKTKKIPLDCLWRIEVAVNWKIQVKFLEFKLTKPNDCYSNFVDIFPQETVIPERLKNFCGSTGEGVVSKSNVLHIHFFAEYDMIDSIFSILFTAIRENGPNENCVVGEEYDCQDMTCIAKDLVCNERDNCKFRWDEEEDDCKKTEKTQSEHIQIIMSVFGVILGGMMITFLVNCMRKLIHDQKIIREHIRQSKESKLDEMGRRSKTRSKENLAVSLRQKQSETSLEMLADLPEHYYPEVVPTLPPSHDSKSVKEKEHSILRHHQHDMTVQTSICDDSSTTTTADGDVAKGETGNACEMGCQTRDSLFVTTPILRKPSIGSVDVAAIAAPPPPRLSTFATEPTIQTIPETPESLPMPHYYSHLHEQQQHIAVPHAPELPPRVYHEPMCHLHHHQQQQHPMMRLPHAQHAHTHTHTHAYDERQPHHHHYHTQRPQQQPLPPLPSAGTSQPQKPQMRSEITLPITLSYSTPSGEATQQPQPPPPVATGRPKLKSRNDQVRDYKDVRNSAPDVIIMTSH